MPNGNQQMLSPKFFDLDKEERSGLLIGSLLTAGAGLAGGGGSREALTRALIGGSLAYGRGKEAIMKQKNQMIEQAARQMQLQEAQQQAARRAQRFPLELGQLQRQEEAALREQRVGQALAAQPLVGTPQELLGQILQAQQAQGFVEPRYVGQLAETERLLRERPRQMRPVGDIVTDIYTEATRHFSPYLPKSIRQQINRGFLSERAAMTYLPEPYRSEMNRLIVRANRIALETRGTGPTVWADAVKEAEEIASGASPKTEVVTPIAGADAVAIAQRLRPEVVNKIRKAPRSEPVKIQGLRKTAGEWLDIIQRMSR